MADSGNGETRAQRATADRAAPAKAITHTVLSHVAAMAQDAGAAAIFAYIDALGEPEVRFPESIADKVVYVARPGRQRDEQESDGHQCLRVPNVPLTRMGQIKVAVFLALSRNLIRPGDVVVFLTGIAESQTLDTVMITQVGREFEMYSAEEQGEPLRWRLALLEQATGAVSGRAEVPR